jgi:hypothetical protein
MHTSDKITLSTKALKGSIARDLDAKDFPVDVNFVESSAITEVTFRLFALCERR